MKKTLVFCYCLSLMMQTEIMSACSCVYMGTFCEFITWNSDNIRQNLCIIRGTVLSNETTGIKVKVVDYLGGVAPVSSEIFIQNSNSALTCFFSTGRFMLGSDYIFAMNVGIITNSDKYILSHCGHSFLSINNNIVEGQISPAVNSIHYNKLGTTSDCIKLPFFKKVDYFHIYPTLTSYGPSIILENDISVAIDIDWAIYSNLGQLLDEKKTQNFEPGVAYTVNMEKYPPGVYFLRLRREEELKVVRIVKI